MKVELFHAAGCERCTAAHESLRAGALAADPCVVWREVDAVRELDYAVELGVATLPSVVIDGELVFTSLPTSEQLRKAVLARRAEVSNGR